MIPDRRQSMPEAKRYVLLLQGPIGPFFKNLQQSFENRGFKTHRVLFHAADALFANKRNSSRFYGNTNDWKIWLRKELHCNKPDTIILFGSSRPAHIIARALAQELDIPVLSLEEGYLRSGYITCEINGNNQHSLLQDWSRKTWLSKNQNPNSETNDERTPLSIRSSFVNMCFFGIIYYLWRSFTETNVEKNLYHRYTRGALAESITWSWHIFRRFFIKYWQLRAVYRLKRRYNGHYILIPLQTASDAQLQLASRGWNNEKLILEALMALKNNKTEKLVFKTHPLDERSRRTAAYIRQKAKDFGVKNRVVVLESGKIGVLTQHSSGMIVINSTSAFSALHHRVPLLVLGDAIYRHKALATLGTEKHCIESFFSDREAKDSENIDTFIRVVKTHTLVPGDFYALKTQKIAAENVVRKTEAIIVAAKQNVPKAAQWH